MKSSTLKALTVLKKLLDMENLMIRKRINLVSNTLAS